MGKCLFGPLAAHCLVALRLRSLTWRAWRKARPLTTRGADCWGPVVRRNPRVVGPGGCPSPPRRGASRVPGAMTRPRRRRTRPPHQTSIKKKQSRKTPAHPPGPPRIRARAPSPAGRVPAKTYNGGRGTRSNVPGGSFHLWRILARHRLRHVPGEEAQGRRRWWFAAKLSLFFLVRSSD